MDLFHAVNNGSLQDVKTSFAPDLVTATDKFGCTLLYRAVRSDNAAIVEFLIQSGCDPAQNNSDGTSAISQTTNPRILSLLLQAGCDPNSKNKSSGNTLLYDAIAENREELCRLLLDKSANPDFINDDGKFPLLAAVLANNPDTIDLLLQHGADCAKKDADGYTAFLTAAETNAKDCIPILAKHSAPDQTDPAGNNALHLAAANDAVESMTQLLLLGTDILAKNQDGLTPLQIAETEKNRQAIQFLTRHAQKLLFDSAERGDETGLRSILDSGMDPNSRDNQGNTVLMLAAAKGHLDCVNCLLQYGSKSYHSNKQGATALDLAASAEIKAVLGQD